MTFMPRITPLRSKHALCIAACLAGTSVAHAAPLQNGDFAQGLSGWQAQGDAAVRSGALWNIDIGRSPRLVLGTATTWSDDDAPDAAGAFNVSGVDPLAAGDAAGLEASLGVATSAFGLNAYEGSSAMQTFDVQAGDRISYSWRLLTRDNDTRFNEPDAAWLLVRETAQTTLQSFATIGTMPMQANTAGWLDSGELHQSFVATQSGPLTLAWAISDTNGFGNTSLLLVGDVTVSAVPEPAALVLGMAGLIALRASRRRLDRHISA